MVERTIEYAAEAMAGVIAAGDADRRFVGAAIDSRRTAGGRLFFALAGNRVDGHDFVVDALRNGAAGVVVERLPSEAPAGPAAWVHVDDTYKALHDLTRSVRQAVPEHLVGITGSMGKTTTKELLAAMLSRRFATAKSPGNLNNLYGFPLALLSIDDDSVWMVAEMGMSTPGELRGVSELGRPDVAVFTNVRQAHLANFGTLAAIADAKAELLAGVADDGIVIANRDDPWVVEIASRHRGPVVYYGLGQDEASTANLPAADVFAVDPRPRSNAIGSRFELRVDGRQVMITLPIHGLYNVENCLAAAACAHTLGVDLDEIAAAMAAFEPGETGQMRGVVDRFASGLVLVDDAYNANPSAVARALEGAKHLPAERHVAVLGDMLELGPDAADFHRQIGEQAVAEGYACVIGVGGLARYAVSAAHAAGLDVEWFASADAAAQWARDAVATGRLGRGDVVLVKGSRGVGLEAVCTALRNAGTEEVRA